MVLAATRQLIVLVAAGTETAAAAGVDLGGGFTSARLAGAYGDRRDAVLAALRVLGVEGAHRLGDRTSTLVALFGLSATKRVGASNPSPGLVCALAIATTCSPSTMDGLAQVAEKRKRTVPGFPASDLADADGPWQHALPAAAELGAPVGLFWQRIAEHGLLIPAALLDKGGWQALWSRAHRPTARN
ncbi:hypothetical protein LWC34_35775 [Kibdelosporangium philippinense]|uniref:Uncharacterized protein n=1 Tax=Kibdelosporangium philippinense TaxID=211113 RepID=A0ABS8ZKZ2_9PSEU|nr:hypothetical protein [Kibdelosporangium philippinense]MCE7008139.1 hypothetical protein [Kibdelosporangium philippinense]